MKKIIIINLCPIILSFIFVILFICSIPKEMDNELIDISNEDITYIKPIRYGNLYEEYTYECKVQLGSLVEISGKNDIKGKMLLGKVIKAGNEILGTKLSNDIYIKEISYETEDVSIKYYNASEVIFYCECDSLDFVNFDKDVNYTFIMGDEYSNASILNFDYINKRIYFNVDNYNFSSDCRINILKEVRSNVYYISNIYLKNFSDDGKYVFKTKDNNDIYLEVDYFNSQYSIIKNKNIDISLEIVI